MKMIVTYLYTGWFSRSFRSFGKSNIVYPTRLILGARFISVGNGTVLGKNIVLTAWKTTELSDPTIEIGNYCSIGDDSHITSANKIIIGNNVLTGKKILITDNAHGDLSIENLNIPPHKRKILSKGPVYIEDDVWIGEKVTILPGVVIGKGCIIAANSVVTKSIPSYSLAAGVPSKIIKQLKTN